MATRIPELSHAFALAGEGREQEAVAIITERARRGDPDALFALADMHWSGGAVAQDYARGRALFAMAAAAGNAMAVRATTNLLASGVAGPRDWPGAIARLRREAQADPLRAHMLWLIDQMDLDTAGDPRTLPEGELLSEAPHVTLFRKVFTQSECDYVMIACEPNFEPSYVISSSGKPIRDPIRTSDGATMHWLVEDPAIHAFNRRIAALTGIDSSHGEALQILRYRPGQQYRRHVDWLGDTNRRLITALTYLNDGYEGGATQFHKVGLDVRGGLGDVLVFRNAGPDGKLDPLTEHAGLPVTKGVKYLASRWIREFPRLTAVGPEDDSAASTAG